MKKILLLGAVLLSLSVQAWAKNVTTENREVAAAIEKAVRAAIDRATNDTAAYRLGQDNDDDKKVITIKKSEGFITEIFDGIVEILVISGIFIAPFATIVLILFFVLRARHNKKKLQAELYIKALEQGKELPADLFAQPAKSNPLEKGIIWAAVGLGVGVFFTASSNVAKGVTLGAIPLCVGLGYLLIHYLSKKRNSSGQC